jgi:mono/diheme cytochrome c family protein
VLAPVVLVFVASTDASGPSAAALADAVAEALGAGARVVLQSYAGAPPGDEQLEAAARAQGAAAAARLVWDRPGGNRAALDLYLAEKDMTVHRGLDFEPPDQPVERGRAIGLVLASLLLGEPSAPPAAPERPTERPPPQEQPRQIVEAAPLPPGPWALEGFADGGLALGGAGAGIGGGLAARFHLSPPWGLRLGLHARGTLLLGALRGEFQLHAEHRRQCEPAARPKPTTGAGLYKDYCENCHGADALGGITMRPIAAEPVNVFIMDSRAGHHPGEFANRREYMPKWTAAELSDAELRSIFMYVDGL